MRLLGRDRLTRLRGQGELVEKWIRSWVAEIMVAHWRSPLDVNNQFPSALHQGNGSFIFPVRDTGLTIGLLVVFPQGIALVTDLKIGNETHGA
jgi:mRNA interferase HigB